MWREDGEKMPSQRPYTILSLSGVDFSSLAFHLKSLPSGVGKIWSCSSLLLSSIRLLPQIPASTSVMSGRWRCLFLYTKHLSFRASVRTMCHYPMDLIPQPNSVVQNVCILVYQSYDQQHPRTHFTPSSFKLNMPMDADVVSPEEAITVAASLANQAGSMVALSFFYWAIGFLKFRHFMRLYIVLATCLMNNGNLERAREVMHCMVRSFGEIGMLKEAVDMVFEMHIQGLVLNVHTLNCVLSVAVEMGCVDIAKNVFVDMCGRGVCPSACSFQSMVVGYCRMHRVLEVDRWLNAMIERGFLVDNATCTLIVNVFCEHDQVNKAFWLFNKFLSMGFPPNVINYTCMINGLCRKGSVKQAFELLEEMVSKGWKPNVYTHTSLIDGLCKKGWTDKAFRLFLKLVRSDNYKPNVHTYTSMISGYCKEEKLNRAEMLLNRMQEQGLIPNTHTYSTLINGYCKSGNMDRANQLLDTMVKIGLVPNICIYNTIVDGLFKRGMVSEAYDMLKKGFSNGCCPDLITYTILMSESCKQAHVGQALALFNKMGKTGIMPDVHVYTTLISALCRQKKIGESERFLNEAIKLGLVPTTETYTSMISGYSRVGNVDMAMKFYQKLIEHGCVPDSLTYCALISGLCKESKLDEALSLYNTMMDRRLFPCEVTRTTIAFELCKKGESSTALTLLDRLETKQLVYTLGSLVRKLCREEMVDIAALFFNRLLDKQLNVDTVTLTAFINACYGSNKYSLVSDISGKIRKQKELENRQI